MTETQRIKNMEIPTGRVDMVLDTDAFNEIDDQFAIAYTLRSPERCNLRQIYAAPRLVPSSIFKTVYSFLLASRISST